MGLKILEMNDLEKCNQSRITQAIPVKELRIFE